jgi:hypothetical protein
MSEAASTVFTASRAPRPDVCVRQIREQIKSNPYDFDVHFGEGLLSLKLGDNACAISASREPFSLILTGAGGCEDCCSKNAELCHASPLPQHGRS